MKLFNKVDQYTQKYDLLAQNQTIIIGISGGPDSVFLLHYLHAKKEVFNLTIIAAHLDHEWRSDSAEDAQFCQKLCAKLGIPIISKKLSKLNIAIKPSGSKEQDARKARRFFFETLAQEYKADTIALAQHKNDQEETFFIRLLRGSSLTGLCGIWPKKDLYVRPLLNITKKEIFAWLDNHNIAYLTDPTNISDDFLRNRIRNKLIPSINEIDARFSTALHNTVKRLQQTELFLQKLTEQTFDQIAQFDTNKNAYTVQKDGFIQLDPVMQYRILVYWMTREHVAFIATQAFFDEIIRFIKQPENKTHAIHETWSIAKKKNMAFIVKRSPQ